MLSLGGAFEAVATQNTPLLQSLAPCPSSGTFYVGSPRYLLATYIAAADEWWVARPPSNRRPTSQQSSLAFGTVKLTFRKSDRVACLAHSSRMLDPVALGKSQVAVDMLSHLIV
jgi:hypothetical protein